MPLSSVDALEILDEALRRVQHLRKLTPHCAEHIAFVQTTGMHLARIFGADSPISLNFSGVKYHATGSYVVHALNWQTEQTRRSMGAYLQGLAYAEGILMSARELLQRDDASAILRASRPRAEGAHVFISHGKESPALTRIERFVRSIGAQPVVVIRRPSKGMAVDDVVEKTMDECDCAIILATGDDTVDGRKQPRPNVLHEIGLAQEKLDNRVIYLKEEGCEFPSNVSPKVWENFSQSSLDAAFEKIAKELSAFGLL